MDQFNNQYQELYHEGILGMHWGQRNGPPYPLSSSQMTPTQRKKNKVSEFAKKRTDRESVKQAKLRAKIRVQKAQLKTKEKKEELKKISQENKDFKKNTQAKSEAEENAKPTDSKVIARLEGVKNSIDAKTAEIRSINELRERNERLRLEQEYARMMGDQVKKGNSFINDIVSAGKDIAIRSAKSAGEQWLTNKLKESLGLKEQNQNPLEKLQNDVKQLSLEKQYRTLTNEKNSGAWNTSSNNSSADKKNVTDNNTTTNKSSGSSNSTSNQSKSKDSKKEDIPHYTGEVMKTPYYGESSSPGTGLVVRRKRDY